MEDKKKSGLQKDISSIFAGLEEIENGRQGPSPSSLPPRASQPVGEDSPGVAKDRPVGSIPSPQKSTPVSPLISAGAFPRRRNSFIGLDIGASSIKLVQFYPVSGGWELGGYALQELGAGGGNYGIFEDENFVRRLKNFFSETGAPRDGVICALRGGEVLTTLIQLARMPKNELESACRLEAGRWASFSVEKSFLQQVAVDRESARPGAKINHLVAVAGRETVGRVLGVLREVGLQVAALFPLPFAWKEYFSSILGFEESACSAVVDIGSERTLISIYKGPRLHFTREFESGGRQVTDAIVQAGKTFGVAGGLSGEEAEGIKRSVDLFSPDGTRPVKGNLTASQVAGMARPVLEKIVQESKRSFDYYRQLYRQEEVNKVLLCGGGALMPGILEFFRKRVRPSVDYLGFPEGVKLHSSLVSDQELKAVFPRLARAAALSLSRKWEVNFIPPLDKILQNILRRKVLIIVPILALFLVSFVFYRSKAALVPIQQRLVEQKREELAGLEKELAPYQVLTGLQRRLKAQRQFGVSASARQPNWKGIMKEFSRITPPNVLITGIMTLKGEGPQRILCSGRVIDSNAALPAGVTQFIVQVENSPFFREVEKISEDIDRGTFSFSCTLNY
ncbi:MAG: pilus assembly protein PilM [Candidatus Erginobacter occultus]|nr:pilus assembly protein PilM [Candidatus Erginobacter occultus]